MIQKILRIVIALIGMILGVAAGIYLSQAVPHFKASALYARIAGIALCGLLFGLIFYIVFPFLMNAGKKIATIVENEISGTPMSEILVGTAGLIVGLIIAYFISGLLTPIPIAGVALSAAVYLLFGYTGLRIATRRKEDMLGIFRTIRPSATKGKPQVMKKNPGVLPPKVLDTSVIIDGRIIDILRTGFLEGKLIVSSFVLEELRHIADSSDDLKRAKGRRGLDVLNLMQKEMGDLVEISEADFEDTPEVDMKLLKLAQMMEGCVITNDYNLNKVAQFQGVKVLNINELANAIKPLVIPGEEMTVNIVKEGKEHNQGVAYLDDGTMIVVEGGKKLIGQTLRVVVTSVLQTAAGRMIFARPK